MYRNFDVKKIVIRLLKYEILMHKIFHPLMIRAVTVITVADSGFSKWKSLGQLYIVHTSAQLIMGIYQRLYSHYIMELKGSSEPTLSHNDTTESTTINIAWLLRPAC